MSEERLVPKLRFIDESDNWNLFKLGEVLDKKGYIRGPFGSALKRGEMKKEGIPVYEQQHAIYNNKIFRYYIDNDKFQELKRFQVFPNDLIVSCSGTIGKTSLITNNDEKGIISQALLILRSNSNIINPKFLKYFLETNSGYNSLISSAGGSSQVNIAKKQIILDIPLLIPNLETQSKIISFLDLINNKIELLEEKHKYYQDFKKYLMQKLFAQELRFDKTSEWETFALNDIGKTYNGLSGLSKDNFEKGNSKYITYKSIFDNNILKSDFTENVDLNNKSQNEVKKGDLFFTGSSETPEEVGMVSVLSSTVEDCYLNSFCFGFRLNNNYDVNPLFLAYYLRSPIMRNKIMILAQGSTRFNLSKKEILKLKVEIPSISEQQQIIDLFQNVDNKINEISIQTDNFNKFKKGLLQQMFDNILLFKL